jgi:signal transduction histidine kinase
MGVVAGMRLRWHLAILVLAAVVPLLIFTAILVQQHFEDARGLLQRGMRDTVRALSTAVDGEVKASWAVLETLAASPLVEFGDLRRSHELSARAVEGRQGAWVVLFDRSGQQLVNSSRPFGAPLPNPFRDARPPSDDPRYPALPLGGAEPVRKVFQTGRRVVSDLFVALDSGQPIIAVVVPVTRGGQVVYALEMSLDPGVFQRLLLDQRPSAGSVETVLDGRGLVIARTVDSVGRLGRPLGADMAAQLRGSDEGLGEGHTWEGVAVYHAFTRSELTGWRTSVGVFQSVAHASRNRSLVLLAGGAAFVMLTGLVAALAIGRRITRPISRLASSAGAIAHGETVALRGSAVHEVTELRDALVAAGETAHAGAAEGKRRLVAETRQAEAQASNRAKDEFLAMLGHELRNPLGVIASAAALLNLPDTPDSVAKRSRASSAGRSSTCHGSSTTSST